jgi:rhodanese-related sulfurtransferase
MISVQSLCKQSINQTMKHISKIVLIAIVFLSSCFTRSDAQVESPKFQKKLQRLLRHNVKEVSIAEVKQFETVIYLDAREKVEYNVSHVENSVWVGYDDFDIQSVEKLDKSKTIIIYCSVGYRSEKVTKKLEKVGFKTVYNLYGGIFEWYNQGLPIVNNDGRETDKIHAYNEKWSQWVKGRKEGDEVF